jgi:hypothetical protein
MKHRLYEDERKVGELAWPHEAGIGVGRWNPSSGYQMFPVFWVNGADLVCREGVQWRKTARRFGTRLRTSSTPVDQ